MQLFYTKNISGQIAILSEEETRHLKVLRKNLHDVLMLIDGTGYLYEARITSLPESKKNNEATLEIISKTLQPKSRSYYFHLYIAPTKQNERMEWMLEKAIETGLDAITFIQTEHSEKTRVNISRLEKIAISAMKQSREFYMPIINENILFSKLATTDSSDLRLMAHCNDHFEKESLKQIMSSNKPAGISIFIGPEGDFSEKEIKLAMENGFKGLSLGNTRLRTETAGLYATIGLSAL